MQGGRDITADLSFFVSSGEGVARYIPGQGLVSHTVALRDARSLPCPLDIDREGFLLAHSPTRLEDFGDEDAIIDRYCPEAERTVCALTGASRAIAFDFTVRRNVSERGPGIQVPARRIHSDFTERSGAGQAASVLGRAGLPASVLQQRYAIINLWRPICPVVLEWPLALCDAQTADSDDYVVTELTAKDGSSESYSVTYSPRHRWYYFPQVTRDELILIKTFDSIDDGRARFTPHGAFADPGTPRDAPPRESIETRMLALFAPHG